MKKIDIEELLLSVIDAPRPERLNGLTDALKNAPKDALPDASEQMDMLWEEWENRKLSVPEAKFIMGIAAIGLPDSPGFRKMMISAVKVLLPPYIAQAPVIKATGVRNDKAVPSEIAARVERLLALRSGAVVFLEGSCRWGVAGTIDGMNASLPMMPFAQVGSNAAVPLEVVLNDAAVLASGPDVSRLVVATGVPVSAALFRMTVEKRRQTAIPEERLKKMARFGCARKLDDAAFEKYWSIGAAQSTAPAAGSAAKSSTRRSCDGRSIKEVLLLLTSEAENGAANFSAEEIAAFRGFFEKLPAATAQRESKAMAEVLAMIADRTPESELKSLFDVLIGKAAFFPGDPATANFDAFAVWGEISSKLLEKLAGAAAKIFDENYLAACALKLPLKALNALCPHISDTALTAALSSRNTSGADLLLWIWKNRKKHKNDNLLALVNLDNASRILSAEEPPKAWTAARRELHTMLLDDWTFQKHLIAMLDDDPVMFGSILQGAIFLSSGERQSLMVKLARQSKEIQEYLESGAGKKILDAGTSKHESTAAPVFEATYTSIKSHQALIKELDDIINIHVPENREALKTARAHGDFRENSEFDAAKERRNHLSRRRSELEKELANIQPVLMKQVEIEDTAVIGSTVEISYSDGREETYYLLGAWDGNPERKFLSYRTRLGKALLNCKVGDSFNAPDGTKCKLLSVSKLPDELIAELDA